MYVRMYIRMYTCVHILQDNINELKSKMATNAREHEAKVKQIKEVNTIACHY